MGTTDFLHLFPWIPDPMLCQQHWWLARSSFLIIFFFLELLPQKSPVAFPFWYVLKSWPWVFLFSRFQVPTFLDSAFGNLFLCYFFSSELIPSCWVESFPTISLHGSSFLDSLRYQPLIHGLLVLKPSDSFLHHWMADRDTSILVPCVS